MALDTIADYVAQARVLLQDTVGPDYRYPDADFILAINLGLLEARRLRPDLFLKRSNNVPSYADLTDTVEFEPQFRPSLLYYIVGHAQLRDEEDVTDNRATIFINKFISQLLTLPS